MIHVLDYKAWNVCPTVVKTKKIDNPHCIIIKNYLEWMITEPKKKTFTPILDSETCLEIKEIIFNSVPYVPGLSEEFRRIFHYTYAKVIFKSNNTLRCKLMHLIGKVPLYLKQNEVYKQSFLKRTVITSLLVNPIDN